ncbi:MAG TPA: CHAD domain-containing protein [Pirellulales bacterium]|nr:CHAD domain-containing protein [Pirellulales bacterium]
MVYRWKAEKSSRSNLRRLARSQLRAAIEELIDPFSDRADAVHDARLRLKKLRSLVRLVRKAAPQQFAHENTAMRDAARALSLQRDRQALIEALDKLLGHAEREWNESGDHLRALRNLRNRFVEAQQHESNGADRSQLIEQVADDLRSATGRLKAWTSQAHDRVVVAGFADSYRRGRLALRAVLADATAENLHEWRKQIKYHRYQVRLFQEAWPAMLEAHCEELRRLSDYLGDDHDLVLLKQALRDSHADELGEQTLHDLVELIERRRSELKADAIPLGQLLFAEKPKHVTRRFMQYWCAYRDRCAAQ